MHKEVDIFLNNIITSLIWYMYFYIYFNNVVIRYVYCVIGCCVYACHGLALVVSYVLEHYIGECMRVVDTSRTYNYGGS